MAGVSVARRHFAGTNMTTNIFEVERKYGQDFPTVEAVKLAVQQVGKPELERRARLIQQRGFAALPEDYHDEWARSSGQPELAMEHAARITINNEWMINA
jgi:hypothetical protein